MTINDQMKETEGKNTNSSVDKSEMQETEFKEPTTAPHSDEKPALRRGTVSNKELMDQLINGGW